jgi:hypothetical protein
MKTAPNTVRYFRVLLERVRARLARAKKNRMREQYLRTAARLEELIALLEPAPVAPPIRSRKRATVAR